MVFPYFLYVVLFSSSTKLACWLFELLGLFLAGRFLGQSVADISLSKIGLLSGLLGSLAEDWGVF